MGAAIAAAAKRRCWTIVLVPPQPTGRTRSLRIRARYVKAFALVTSVSAAAFGLWATSGALDVTATADQLADAQNMIVALSDSLRAARDTTVAVARIQQQNAEALAQASVPLPHASRQAPPHWALAAGLGLSRPASGVVLPVIGEITSRFARSRFHPILHIFRPHLGVDVAAPYGANITAPAAGRVAFVGHLFGDGLVVDLDHGSGVMTRYAHCSRVVVHVGQMVNEGTIIAKVGSSGLATGPHVHFEVRVNGRPVDPMRYLIAPHLVPLRIAPRISSPSYIARAAGDPRPMAGSGME